MTTNSGYPLDQNLYQAVKGMSAAAQIVTGRRLHPHRRPLRSRAPGHVTFVLATTDPQRVLPTIRSRCQHFEFGLIPAAELEAHVRRVAADAGIELDDEAVAFVVRRGGGSARDTLSVLEQVAALGGVPAGGEPLDGLLDALVERDSGRALGAVAQLVAAGREPRLVAEQLLARPARRLPHDDGSAGRGPARRRGGRCGARGAGAGPRRRHESAGGAG